jgi:hypothetical protein
MPTPELKKINRAKRRRQAGLDTQLDKNLRAYETAARAATANHALAAAAPLVAVSLCVLAFPQITFAEVVCTTVNESVQGNRGHLLFDLNNDGVADVSVSAYSTLIIGSGDNFARSDYLGARALVAGNAVAADRQRYALAGRGGQQLGSAAHFSNTAIMARHGSNLNGSTNRGQWRNVNSRRFLGIKFLISGETHFGWIRFSSSVTSRLDGARATVTGYAYETVPNKPIIAGLCKDGLPAPEGLMEPASGSLGRLAAGAGGR